LSRLDPKKLHVRFKGVLPDGLALPRRYTLTHSDRTGDLFLTVSSEFDDKQISKLYTRLMRDEVLAEWKTELDRFFLHICCHVCGGFVFGTASLRESIFRRELPLAIEAITHGDRELVLKDARLTRAEIIVHFQKPKAQNCKVEPWGYVTDYRP